MDHKERIRLKAEARLARLRPNTGHARILRAKLGISDAAPAPAPVVEEVVEPVVEEKPKKRVTRKKKED